MPLTASDWLVKIIVLLLVAFMAYDIYCTRFWVPHDAGSVGVCRDHERKICEGMLLYAQANDDRLPGADSWVSAAEPYIGGRARNGETGSGEAFRCPESRAKCGYGMNELLSNTQLTSVENDNQTVLIVDCAGTILKDRPDWTAQIPWNRHEGFASIETLETMYRHVSRLESIDVLRGNYGLDPAAPAPHRQSHVRDGS